MLIRAHLGIGHCGVYGGTLSIMFFGGTCILYYLNSSILTSMYVYRFMPNILRRRWRSQLMVFIKGSFKDDRQYQKRPWMKVLWTTISISEVETALCYSLWTLHRYCLLLKMFDLHRPVPCLSSSCWGTWRGWTSRSRPSCPAPHTRTCTPASGWSQKWTRSGKPEMNKVKKR